MKNKISVVIIIFFGLLFISFTQRSELEIVIEHPRGSIRSGVNHKGEKWQTKMVHDYGYIKRTKGADGEKIDVYIGPNPNSKNIFIITQLNPLTGEFDEYKVMIGFKTEQEAKAGYLAHYPKDWKGYGGIKKINNLKEWITKN